MKASRKRTAAPTKTGARSDRKSAPQEEAVSKSKTTNDQREAVIVGGAKAKRRLDRPARKRYADGGDVTDGLRSFRAIEQAFAPPDFSSAPAPRQLTSGVQGIKSATPPYDGQNTSLAVPSLDPRESFERYKQIIAHGLPRGFAAGGHVRSPSPSLRQASLGIDTEHPAYATPNPDKPDAPDVVQAKSMLHSPDASRISDKDVKAIGDYIIHRQKGGPAAHLRTGGRVSFQGGAGSGEGRIEKAEHAGIKRSRRS